jgi:hypothetical protein
MTRSVVGKGVRHLITALARESDECMRWPWPKPNGYGRVTLNHESWGVHALVCTWYHGPRPEGMEARHLCNNGHLGCFNPAHIVWGTKAEQGEDRRRTGRMLGKLAGERHPRVRLTDEQVATIRARYRGSQRGRSTGPTQQALADEFGVTQTHISKVLRGERRGEEGLIP